MWLRAGSRYCSCQLLPILSVEDNKRGASRYKIMIKLLLQFRKKIVSKISNPSTNPIKKKKGGGGITDQNWPLACGGGKNAEKSFEEDDRPTQFRLWGLRGPTPGRHVRFRGNRFGGGISSCSASSIY